MPNCFCVKLILSLISLWLIVACAPTGIYHTVQPGQTLYRIARTYEINETKLARINHISDPTRVKVGQKLYIPGQTQLRKVPVTVATSMQSTSTRVSASQPVSAKTAPRSKTTTVKQSTAKMPAKATSSPKGKPVKGLFVWPVKGKVVNKFGSDSKSTFKGIEIAVPKGTAIVAAAPGKVIYSGNAIRGYGNLVILEHSNSYFTVYGYNQKNLAKLDSYVGKGDKIALSGTPGNGQSARLHFEIRHGKVAVNPIFYLP